MSRPVPVHELTAGLVVEVAPLQDEPPGDDRAPHRHDFHEVLWVREGTGRHLLDGAPAPVRPGSVTLVGRGQVHLLERGDDLRGLALRFRDEIVGTPSAQNPRPGWMLAGAGGRIVDVPADGEAHLEGALAALAAETLKPACGVRADLERHLVSVVLLWIEQWGRAETDGEAVVDDAVRLHRRFVSVLEHDFARHHGAAHYADELSVPPRALAKALTRVTGRTTKELVTDRVMVEAARLLRFTDLTVGQVAHEVGFSDALYFSRACRRNFGVPPGAYREQVRGAGSGEKSMR